MSESVLTQAVEGVTGIKSVLITAMPDCLLYDSWMRFDLQVRMEDAATYFGDLVRANRQGLKALGSLSAEMQVTIEAKDNLVVLTELDEHFVCSCVFEPETPLGMIRLHVKRILDLVRQSLPKLDLQQRPRGARVLDFLQRYAPDPHAVLLRASLRTGIPMEQLERAGELDEAKVGELEAATKAILGLQSLNL